MATAEWCCRPDKKSSADVLAVELQREADRIVKLCCQYDYDVGDMNSYKMTEEYREFAAKLVELAGVERPEELAKELEIYKEQAKALLYCASKGTASDPLSRVLQTFSRDYDAVMESGRREISRQVTEMSEPSEPTAPTNESVEGWTRVPPEVEQEILTYAASSGDLLNRLNAQELLLNGEVVSDGDHILGNVPVGSIYYR